MPARIQPESLFPLERLYCPALRLHPNGKQVARILQAALSAVEPGAAVRRRLRRDTNTLWIGEKAYNLKHVRQVRLVGFGKASLPMGQAAAAVLDERLHSGILITKQGQVQLFEAALDPRLTVLEAAHPVPDESSLAASQQVITYLEGLTPDDLVVCLISGGGSALLTAPAEGVSLDDLRVLTGLLLSSGASINEVNTLRKHLEQLKGGGLAQIAAPAQVAVLALSDVIGDPLDVIASGPAVPDPTRFGDALGILERYRLLDQTPDAIRRHLQAGSRGELPDTPKPGNPLFKNVYNQIVGSNRQAARAAMEQAKTVGLQTVLLTTYLQGEARQAGRFIAALGRELGRVDGPVTRPGCLIFGGETTVTVRGDGLGGRNQELALGAVAELSGLDGLLLVTLATDGGDGPTDAAGAVVDGGTLDRAQELGLDPGDFLQRNDAYHFFEPLAALLQPGPTQTNVNDLAFLFAF
jgi:glycerate 2-kinase